MSELVHRSGLKGPEPAKIVHVLPSRQLAVAVKSRPAVFRLTSLLVSTR